MRIIRVWARHRFVGFHHWPEAPPSRAYLASRHRHLFHVEATLSVDQENREVEFHDLLAFVAGYCETLEGDLGARSCEMLASEIARAMQEQWPGRVVQCSVSEDGECGSSVQLWT